MEYKSFQSKATVDKRVVKGIFSVLGNRDSYGDRVMIGAFRKTFSEGRKRIRHLWNHDGYSPPIAKILDLYEISKADLPDEVLSQAPSATGGAVVVREYLNTPRADEVLVGIAAGAILEMSFAFDVVGGRFDFSEEVIDGEKVTTRYLRELKLYDTSDVNWGANDATLATRSLPVELIASNLKSLLTEYKERGRNSRVDSTIIQSIHDLTCDAKCQRGKKGKSDIMIEADELIAKLTIDSLIM